MDTAFAPRGRSRSRAAMLLLGCAVAWTMGVRSPRAASFDNVAFAGKGRATLVIEESVAAGGGDAEGQSDPGAGDADERFGLLEVFAKMTFGTEISVFSKGLYARSSFTLPDSGTTAVLVVDVDRGNGVKDWKAGDRGLRARLYTMPKGGEARFEGEPVSGSLELEAAIIGRNAAGFRIRGWLEMLDAGPDGVKDSEDDTVLEVDLTLESIPTPEEIAGQPAPTPRQPQGGFCEAPWCWTDGGYYDGYSYGYGCGDAEVGYDTTSDGCAGDTIEPDDGVVIEDDGSTAAPGTGDVTSSDGCGDTTSDSGLRDDPGCEGTDGGSSNDGCDGGDSGSGSSGCDDSGSNSGCSDSSGGSSGCGSSGCEGDTLERADGVDGSGDGDEGGLSKRAGIELIGLGLFIAAMATWISDGRRRRRGGD